MGGEGEGEGLVTESGSRRLGDRSRRFGSDGNCSLDLWSLIVDVVCVHVLVALSSFCPDVVIDVVIGV